MNAPKKQPKVQKPTPALPLKSGIKAGATWAGN
jgi:hypothetical protein